MKEMTVGKLKLSGIRSFLILINYLFGVIGGYRKVKDYLVSVIGGNQEYTNIIIQLILYLFIILITVILAYPLIQESIKNFKREQINDIFSILALTSIALIFIMIIANNFQLKTALNQLKNEATLKNNLFYSVFVALIYAPIVEEIVFRGVIYGSMKNKFGIIISIAISSFLFALLHNISSLNDWCLSQFVYFIVYLTMGICFGISYNYTKSILGAMISHFLWNGLTLIPMIIKIYILN